MSVHTGQSGTRRSIRGRVRPRSALLAAATVAAALFLGACTSKSPSGGTTSAGSGTPGGSSAIASAPAPTSTSATPDPAAVITSSLDAKKTNLNPTVPITLTAKDGTLSDVTMLTPDGRKVVGALSDDKSSWRTTEYLGYGRTYRIAATATNGDGASVTRHLTATTLTPGNMTQPYLDTVYGSSIQNGAVYGVGFIPVVHFDESIPDRAAAERALHVTTSPHVDGMWTWATDSDLHWRPQNYLQPGTKVTISAKVYGVNVGNGMYGQSDQSISYTIGQRRVSIADAATHQVKVYFDSKLQRTMPTSMGRGGTVKGDHGQTIYLWTMPGTYTVIGHENPATMSSDSYGLPSNSQFGYPPEKVPYATKISTDGIYLHELDTTVWAQGHSNVSHGCLNLNYTNAKWYYDNSRVGDIVQVIHSGGPEIQLWQGGDWSVPWSTWVSGSALH